MNDDEKTTPNGNTVSASMKARPSIRHIEKRRTSTCKFADRIAEISIGHYRKLVPKMHQGTSTCLATVVAHDRQTDSFVVLGMGVGTKFLQESVLRQEHERGFNQHQYGRRVRDCHAEVLARRAFRRAVTLEIQRHLVELQNRREDGASTTSSGDITEASKYTNILEPISPPPSIESSSVNDRRTKFAVKEGITLHFYASSTPCGNATLKKFAKMQKERYRDDLGPMDWPSHAHDPIHDGSIHLGQFALLVKKDSTNHHNKVDSIRACSSPSSATVVTPQHELQNVASTSQSATVYGPDRDSQDSNIEGKFDNVDTKKRSIDDIVGTGIAAVANKSERPPPNKSKKVWPAMKSDDWCPPGTTIVSLDKGSIHSCSDKLCRWNILGLQGSLLSSLLQFPLYMSTLTVGRKFTECICRRAVCCRLERRIANKKKNTKTPNHDGCFRLHHPAIMGTAVYLDEGAMESNTEVFGQDVRFHSSLSWASWPSLPSTLDSCTTVKNEAVNIHQAYTVECIHGSSGLLVIDPNGIGCNVDAPETIHDVSQLSTYSLGKLFEQTLSLAQLHQQNGDGSVDIGRASAYLDGSTTLAALREWKRQVSAEYEKAKDDLLNHHRILRQWKRRMS